ncbi:MAG: hypothetical protein CM1200mP29_14050 [Verrucomicrobiota bacterium]|nr:MAG: hypothetical protein CM1200mP29_14050 [Verrucomicrobiota bacterium]
MGWPQWTAFHNSSPALLLLLCHRPTPRNPGKISKVLPHWLDQQGRHTLSPSLLERDAYQAKLRADRSLCSGIRFDVKWSKNTSVNVKLQLELRVTGDQADRTRAGLNPSRLAAGMDYTGRRCIQCHRQNHRVAGAPARR